MPRVWEPFQYRHRAECPDPSRVKQPLTRRARRSLLATRCEVFQARVSITTNKHAIIRHAIYNCVALPAADGHNVLLAISGKPWLMPQS